MIAEMIIWGFFSAMGWLSANWVVEQVTQEEPKQVTQPAEKKE